MKRPRTTSPAAPPPGQIRPVEPELPAEPAPAPPPPLWRETAAIVAALLAVLDAIEVSPRSGPAVRAYQSAIRRQGEAATALGGPEAMEAVLHQVAEADPARAPARILIIRSAWTELLPEPGGRSRA